MTLFVAAGVAVMLALTSRLWLPAIPTLFGAIEANSDLIGAFADFATVATFVILLVGGALAYLGYRNLQNVDEEVEEQQAAAVVDHGPRGTAGGDADRTPGDWTESEARAPGPKVRAIMELQDGFNRFQREKMQRGLDRTPRHGALEVAAVVDGADVPGGSPTQEFLNRLSAANPSYTSWPLWSDTGGRGDGSEPYTLDGGWETLTYEYSQGSPFNKLEFWRADPAGRFYAYRGFEDDVSEGPTYPEAMSTLDFGMAIWRVAEAIAVPMAFARAMGFSPEKTTVVYAFRWSGLRDRRLSSWTNPTRSVFVRQESRQNVEEPPPLAVPLDTPTSALGPFVREATSGMFAAFGGFEPDRGVTEELANEMLARGRCTG